MRTVPTRVLLGNFEVEQQWALGESGLPTVSFAGSRAIVNRMDELALFLAGPDDHLILKTMPDPAYLEYVERLGFPLPQILVPDQTDPQRPVTVEALESPKLLHDLTTLAERGAALEPHGISDLEERLAVRTGLRLAGPSAAVCKAVNSKVYSRRLAERTGLRQATGWACDTVEQLTEAVTGASAILDAGRPVVVKDAYGVSGNGLVVVSTPRRLEQLTRMVRAGARRRGHDRIGVVIEEWVDKSADLNYQFTVEADGEVRFDFVREAVTENGVHKGHRIPARLNATGHAELTTAARVLGAGLAADGYTGVVGVDALVDAAGGIYPVVEINARRNMSTYLVTLHDRFIGPDLVALSRYYPVRVSRPVPFSTVERRLADLLLTRSGGDGMVINAFGTVNAATTDATEPVDGRLYALLVAASAQRLTELDRTVTQRLSTMEDK